MGTVTEATLTKWLDLAACQDFLSEPEGQGEEIKNRWASSQLCFCPVCVLSCSLAAEVALALGATAVGLWDMTRTSYGQAKEARGVGGWGGLTTNSPSQASVRLDGSPRRPRLVTASPSSCFPCCLS